MIFFFILITCLLDIVLILQGEILSWSLVGIKRLTSFDLEVVHHSSLRQDQSNKYFLLTVSRQCQANSWMLPQYHVKLFSLIYRVMLITKKGEFPIGSLELKVDLSITPNYNHLFHFKTVGCNFQTGYILTTGHYDICTATT